MLLFLFDALNVEGRYYDDVVSCWLDLGYG